MKSFLPDRERRHLLQFHVAPRLSYVKRLLIALLLIVAGLGLQYYLLSTGVGLGAALAATVLIFAGNIFLLLKGYDLEPRGAVGGEWERTTVDRFEETFHHDEKIRKWDSNFADVTCGLGCLTFVLFVMVPAFIVVVLLLESGGPSMTIATEEFTGHAVIVLLLDVLALIVPHWVTGVRKKWKPAGLLERIRALRAALAKLQEEKNPSCQIQPMMRVVKKGDKQVPTDARVFIRFPDGPEEFLGLQLQVAINLVQGTRYAYLYAVLVAKREYDLLKNHLKGVQRLCEDRNISVECEREKDVEVIVIRQHTTKKSGYHTNDAAVARLTAIAWRCAASAMNATVA